jgi:hypothetical protein
MRVEALRRPRRRDPVAEVDHLVDREHQPLAPHEIVKGAG